MTEIVVTNPNPNLKDTKDTTDTSSIIGECGVCGTDLPSDANHAYTICKHLFCISCLLKWYKANPIATCPMCRASLFSEEPAESVGVSIIRDMSEPDYDSDEAFFEHAHQQEEEHTRTLIEALDFNAEEEELHEVMVSFVANHARNYCSRLNGQYTYMEAISLFNFPSNDYNDYLRCDYGITNPNCFYIFVMKDASRAFRYKFGRIENIHTDNIIDGVYWFVFREMNVSYGPHDHVLGLWSAQTQFISFDDVRVLIQYIPRIRVYA